MHEDRGTTMKNLLMGICTLTLAVLACNLNKSSPSSLSQAAINTVVAQTMQAFESASPTAPTVLMNTPALNTPVLSTPTLMTPGLMTPSPSATPMAVIKAVTYCLAGPAETYNGITNLNPNQTAAVLGKDSSGDYWLIQTASGECWVAAQYVVITGNTQNIPTVTPPPTTTTGVPAEPGSVFYIYSCPSLTETVITLTWKDVANDETGYRVYRNGSPIAELPANSTTYTDDTSRGSGSTFSYSVEAFNSIGTSTQRTTGSFSLSNCANP